MTFGAPSGPVGWNAFVAFDASWFVAEAMRESFDEMSRPVRAENSCRACDLAVFAWVRRLFLISLSWSPPLFSRDDSGAPFMSPLASWCRLNLSFEYSAPDFIRTDPISV